MFATRRRIAVAVFSLAFFSIVLTACGGGGMKATPPAPVFTSTPPSAAAQGSEYSYSIVASDPAGGSVSFSLTTGPTGAGVNGSTLTWTPAAAQSRAASSFTVTATTSEGGSATQSWNVSPTGTVTVSMVDTDWTSSGPVNHPFSLPVVNAIILNTDGSATVLTGTIAAPGVATIANVPAGHYWLVMGLNTTAFFDAVWTSSSSIDVGRDAAGTPTPITTAQTTTFDFNLSGLTATTPPAVVAFMTDDFEVLPMLLNPAAGSSTLTASVATTAAPNNRVDWTQINSAFLAEYEPFSAGTLNGLILGPELSLTGLSFSNGATNSITETLQSSPQTSINLNVPGSQWAPLFQNAGPSTPSSSGNSWLSIGAEPYVTGINAPTGLLGPSLYMMMPNPLPTFGGGIEWPGGACVAPLPFLPSNQPLILTDQSFGTLQYGDPFPSAWTRALQFCQQTFVQLPAGGSLTKPATFQVVAGTTVAPSNTPIVPLVSQVQNPMINGNSLFALGTLNTTSVSLNWSAPGTGAPYGYSITPWQITMIPDGVQFASQGTFVTAETSIALPPLAAGNTYMFTVSALSDGAANVETSPFRSALPTGFADVISAPITISSGAAQAEIHGDASVIKALSGTRRLPGASGDTPTGVRIIR